MEQTLVDELVDKTAWGQLVARGACTNIPYAQKIYQLFAGEVAQNDDPAHGEECKAQTPLFEVRWWHGLVQLAKNGLMHAVEVGSSHAPTGLVVTAKSNREFLATGRGSSLLVSQRIKDSLGQDRPNLSVAELDILLPGMFQRVIANWRCQNDPFGVLLQGVMLYMSPDMRRKTLHEMHSVLLERGGAIITSDNWTQESFLGPNGKVKSGIQAHSERSGTPLFEYALPDLPALEAFYQECGYEVAFHHDGEVIQHLTCPQKMPGLTPAKLNAMLTDSWTAVLKPIG